MACRYLLTDKGSALHAKTSVVSAHQGLDIQCCALQLLQGWVNAVCFSCGLEAYIRIIKLVRALQVYVWHQQHAVPCC